MARLKCISIIFLTTILGILTLEDCQLEKQNFMKNFVVEQAFGRWYLAEMKRDTFDDIRGGAVVDLYQRDGMKYFNLTYLNLDHSCRRTEMFNISIAEDRRNFAVWSHGTKAAEIWPIASNYHTYSVDYFCTVSGGDACVDPIVHVWSRTKEIPADTLEEVKQAMDRLCVPKISYSYHLGNYQRGCPAGESTRDVCRIQSIPYLVTMDINKMTGRWYLMDLYFGQEEGVYKDFTGYGGDIYIEHGEIYSQFYSATDTACTKLPRATPIFLMKGKVTAGGDNDKGLIENVVDIKYDSYLIIWICNETDGDICPKPQLRVFSRQTYLRDSIRKDVEKYLKLLCLPGNVKSFSGSAYDRCPPRNSSDSIGPRNGTNEQMKSIRGKKLFLTLLICISSWRYVQDSR